MSKAPVEIHVNAQVDRPPASRLPVTAALKEIFAAEDAGLISALFWTINSGPKLRLYGNAGSRANLDRFAATFGGQREELADDKDGNRYVFLVTTVAGEQVELGATLKPTSEDGRR